MDAAVDGRMAGDTRVVKVFVEGINLREPVMYNGKGKFIRRLAISMRKLGVQFVDDPADCDINFRMNALSTTSGGKKVVRFDDACYSEEAMHRKNRHLDRMRRSILSADGAVYQSSVARRMCERTAGCVNAKSAVIHNGVNPSEFTRETEQLEGRKNYVMACEWIHPMRRVEEFVEDCWLPFVELHTDAWFYLLYGRKIGMPHVAPRRNMVVDRARPQHTLNPLLASADAVLFLKFQDSCPNLAIEALACGTPIILSNTNGLWDVLESPAAIKVNIDGPEQLGKRSWDRPPFYRRSEVIRAMERVYDNDKPVFSFPDALHIDAIAAAYMDFFSMVL